GERGDDYAIFKNGKLITYDVAKYYKHPSKDTAAYKPKKTACTAIKSAAAKKLTVAWKKRTNIKGYQIQYAYDKDFKNAKTVTVANASKVSKTIGGLKSGSVVSIRIRTYEEIGRTRYYSAWDKNTGTAVKIK
ncbi:MAG: fibronectin type III domain-containing protein, partial [bacterium]|nr:fibronectin type III domain-containing protein [bacterium]